MRRLLVVILSMLYMAGATGATVHIHYCMGKIMSASLLHEDKDKCDRCGMKKDARKNCCKDEQKTLHASDHEVAKVSFNFAHCDLALGHLPAYSFYSVPVYATAINIAACAHAPPSLWRTCPIYIQVRNFRI